ncbi:recombinase family protein [Sabulicella glaciei]|uniref:Recombinase family protein n=1 Tax=Sabulicella glaciei TaxID=2984948 RepID=A0ABT3P0F2_9PROT|nr:recombinase family protein [Roseococcus sp. MDT2-1-1]MCW8087653.1 recombinase family protein [Roseococcus sp. MDT2-1-1]
MAAQAAQAAAGEAERQLEGAKSIGASPQPRPSEGARNEPGKGEAAQSPIAIAKALNVEGIPAPRGGAWTDGALRVQARLGTGILRNALYVGRLVWSRRRWLKDPVTGQRLARRNEAETFVTEEVPELHIVEQGLWDRVQQRLTAA